ncbi:MAG TPA: hypothetical protein VJZ69_05695 [Clostridia bacterium]|nr:hypothetical protein [Clostridia bacterium]
MEGNKSNLKFSTRDIAISGVLLTFILLFVFVPFKIGFVDMAFIPLLAIYIGCQVVGGKVGIFLATAFGLASLLATVVRPTVLSPLFYNPMVSVVPRIMIGITTYFSYVGLRRLAILIGKRKGKLLDKRMSILVSSSLSSVIGTLTNTGLVLGMLAAFNFGKTISGIAIDGAFFAMLISVNFIIEVCVAAIVTPWIVLALRKALHLSEPEDDFAHISKNKRTVLETEVKNLD